MSELDRYFPKQGPCMFCCLLNAERRDARHRIIDAIRERVAAHDSQRVIAEDFGIPLEAVLAAVDASDDEASR